MRTLRPPLASMLICAALASRAGAVEQAKEPYFATFSLCAVDPATGESGAVVTTRVPFVGRAVPWVRAGVGAVATQAWTVVEYGPKGLDLLAQGAAPSEAIERLLADDRGREHRQLGMIDMQGRAAAFSGRENGAWAGSRQGRNYTAQGNILVGPEVVDAVAESFETTEGSGMPLAERLILALQAGQAKGGDRRWGLFQSAALRVADPNDPGRGGDHLSVVIDVGEHPAPVEELERIYRTTSQRLGYRSFSEVKGRDVVELKRMLHGLGFWRPELQEFPKAPVMRRDPSLLRTDPERAERESEAQQQALSRFLDEYGAYDAGAIEAVDAFRKAHGLEYQGNPRGLVDARLVEALRKAHYARVREKPPGIR
ncbi:MAG TPA: DUF1028 domain-containing protein [Vicinamibacteria bacterium]|nr:DUF1028 domain-containing protein [Vicinamibacteria bacterium]